ALLGQSQLAAGDPAGAAQSFERLLRKHGEHALADDAAALLVESLHLAGEPRRAVEVARLFEKRWPDSALRERVLLFGGLARAADGQWREAGGAFERLLADFGDGALAPQAEFMLAQCYELRGLSQD